MTEDVSLLPPNFFVPLIFSSSAQKFYYLFHLFWHYIRFHHEEVDFL